MCLCVPYSWKLSHWPFISNVIEGCIDYVGERLRTTFLRFLPALSSMNEWEPNRKVVIGKQRHGMIDIEQHYSQGGDILSWQQRPPEVILSRILTWRTRWALSALIVGGVPTTTATHLLLVLCLLSWSEPSVFLSRVKLLMCTLDPSVLASSRSLFSISPFSFCYKFLSFVGNSN